MLRDDGPSEEFQRSAAFYGINFIRAGQLRTFDAYWSQIIAVSLPSVSDYDQISNELRAYCLLMDDDAYAPIDINTNKTIRDIFNKVKQSKDQLTRACRGFERTMKITLNDLINSAFKESLPNPTIMRDKTVELLTSKVSRQFQFSSHYRHPTDMRHMIGDTSPHLLHSDLPMAMSFVPQSTPGENGADTSSTHDTFTTSSVPVATMPTVTTSSTESMTPIPTSPESVTSAETTTLVEQTSPQSVMSSTTEKPTSELPGIIPDALNVNRNSLGRFTEWKQRTD